MTVDSCLKGSPFRHRFISIEMSSNLNHSTEVPLEHLLNLRHTYCTPDQFDQSDFLFGSIRNHKHLLNWTYKLTKLISTEIFKSTAMECHEEILSIIESLHLNQSLLIC